jgi:TnpA family transposase
LAVNILSPEERERLSAIPLEIDDADLVRFFTLQPADLALLSPYASLDHHLDQAAHICLLRWLGWSPVRVDRLPQTALLALCRQLHRQVPSDDLKPPAPRTSRLHAQRAREHLGWRKCTAEVEHALGERLKPLAAEHDRGNVLLDRLLRHLYQEQIVRPGLSRLERLVETIRTAVREEIAAAINAQRTGEQKRQLDDLLVVPTDETRSPLQRLKETPPKASRPHLLTILEKSEAIRAIGLDELDLGQVHPNRIKLLAQRTRRRTNWATSQLVPEQRYPLLVCFLHQTLPNLIDLAVQMHGEMIHRIFWRAEKRRDDQVVRRGQILNDKVLLLAQLVRMILDESSVPDTELRSAIYACIPRERLAHTVRECDEIAQPADYASFTFAVGNYSHLRSFGPHFLGSLQFETEDGMTSPLLEAIVFLRAADCGERAFEDPPLKFVPWRWRPYVGGKKGPVNRPMYELCLHDCLAKALERGELWVAGSRTYTSFRSDWIRDDTWPAARQAFLHQFPHLADADAFLEGSKTALDTQMDAANRAWPDLQDQGAIGIDTDGTVHLARLEGQELPPGTTRLQERLTRLFPRIGVAQLLLEVNHWVGIDGLLTNLYAQEHPTENLTAKRLTVLMAEGLNIGLQNMSNCVPGVSYADLAGVYDRYIRDDTLRQAIVAVVSFYDRLPITRHWGDGTASSSDGQLFGIPVRTIYSQYHPKSPSKSGRAVSLYTHVSDHAIPFYGQVIHHLGHEGAYVLDGLLHHETDLSPKRHFVDTHGYQDTLWGACHLLGFSLEPRIRDIGEMRLFRMRRRIKYEHIRSLFSAAVNTRAIRENWDDVLRLMASIYLGVVPASQVLRKLNAHHVESGLYKALREIGRIAKTLFLLRYFTQPEVQREVQVGLNRQESVHSLVRSLCVGQRGEFRLRDLDAQLDRASCLQLVTAMVITWNAAYLSAAVERLESEGMTATDEQLAHILPVMWEHINLLGRYEFDVTDPSIQTDLSALPLRSIDEIVEQLGFGI